MTADSDGSRPAPLRILRHAAAESAADICAAADGACCSRQPAPRRCRHHRPQMLAAAQAESQGCRSTCGSEQCVGQSMRT